MSQCAKENYRQVGKLAEYSDKMSVPKEWYGLMPSVCQTLPRYRRSNGTRFFLSIEHFINQKKLIFMHYSATLDETSLANQICAIRKELKFPCFIPETKKLLHFYGLPDVSEKPFETKKKRWAGLVKSAERNTSVFNTFFLLNLGAKFCL